MKRANLQKVNKLLCGLPLKEVRLKWKCLELTNTLAFLLKRVN
jgi:hypothetical protein